MAKTVNIYDVEGKVVGKLTLPSLFDRPVRSDLIRRAVVALQSHLFQPQGRDPMAGKRTTAKSIGVGFATARVPRVKGDRYPRANAAAFAPSTVKGRLTFPPTATKQIRKKINRKELRLATVSALAAASSKELIMARGHRMTTDHDYPIVVSDELEKIGSSSEAAKLLKNLGVWEDVERASNKKIRSGRGTMRGRPSRHPVSALVVIHKKGGVEKAFRNFPGINIVEFSSLNVSDLAPGTHPGRLTIWSESALKGIEGRFGGGQA